MKIFAVCTSLLVGYTVASSTKQTSRKLQENVLDIIDGTTLASLISSANLEEAVAALEDPITLFAPSDAALASGSVPAKFVTDAYSQHLANVLLSHVADEVVTSADIPNLTGTTMLSTEMVSFTTVGDDLAVTPTFSSNPAIISNPDQNATDGSYVHTIEGVIAPTWAGLDVVDLASQVDELSSLVEAVAKAGLVDFLKASESLTILAPTNAAIAQIGGIDNISAEALAEVLKYHVFDSIIYASDLTNGTVTPLSGQDLEVFVPGTGLPTFTGSSSPMNEATVITANIFANNAVVHLIDTVLMPLTDDSESVAEIISGTTLGSLIDQLGLTDGLTNEGPLTLFAPDDAAFSSVDPKYTEPQYSSHLLDILSMHLVEGTVLAEDVVPGKMIETANFENNITVTNEGTLSPSVNGAASVTIADQLASNGVVHFIDDVLAPSWLSMNLVELGQSEDGYETLLRAVATANLTGALSNPDANYTLFAPTDAAFAKIPNLDSILADVDLLTDILLLHVVPRIVSDTDIVESGVQLETLAGENLTVGITPNTTGDDLDSIVTLDSLGGSKATIIMYDGYANNGIAHGIDTVLLPESLKMSDPPTAQPTMAPTDSPSPAMPSGGLTRSAGIVFTFLSTAFVMIL